MPISRVARRGRWIAFETIPRQQAALTAAAAYRTAASPESLAEQAGRIADAAVSVVLTRRGVEEPLERLLRAVDGIGLHSLCSEELQARLRAVRDAAALVKSARGS